MGNWKYFELLSFYYRSFFSALQQNRAIDVAIQTTFDDYLFRPQEDYKVVYLIISILNLDIQIALLKKVYKESVDFHLKQLKAVSNEKIRECLLAYEVEHLEESIVELNYKLKNMKTV